MYMMELHGFIISRNPSTWWKAASRLGPCLLSQVSSRQTQTLSRFIVVSGASGHNMLTEAHITGGHTNLLRRLELQSKAWVEICSHATRTIPISDLSYVSV